MRALVLGAGGMAGHVIATHLRELGHKVDTLSASNPLDDETILLDVTETRALDTVLAATRYNVVINCVGMLVKESEARPDLASYLNAYLPHHLERRFQDERTKLIHISTDCVFSGTSGPYHENAAYDGQLFYDRSKALGEVRNDKDLTFRMSIVGPDNKPHGTGLFNWFARASGTISGFTNAMWTGVTTIELAKAIVEAIDQDLCGLYHLVPTDNISKFELLTLFRETFWRDDIIIEADSRPAPDKTLVNTRTDFRYTVPDYASMVEEMRDWVKAHPHLYPHYENIGARR
jgi:dTDP-4-dehydrorhamnose reductase